MHQQGKKEYALYDHMNSVWQNVKFLQKITDGLGWKSLSDYSIIHNMSQALDALRPIDDNFWRTSIVCSDEDKGNSQLKD